MRQATDNRNRYQAERTPIFALLLLIAVALLGGCTSTIAQLTAPTPLVASSRPPEGGTTSAHYRT